MPLSSLPLEALPGWCRLNNVTFFDVAVAPVPERGIGVMAERNLSASKETSDITALMAIPRDLILSQEAVEEYAKEDKKFRELLNVVGRHSPREDILLFLFVQLAITSQGGHHAAGVSNPWTTYIRFLPSNPPIPTMWTQEERQLLNGTSLEPALAAKLAALNKEFTRLKDSSSENFSWYEMLWEQGSLTETDWLLADAWYRTRCLELSGGQSVMVPCVDMANHSATPNAYYDINAKDELVLSLRENCSVSGGDEIVINYGDKSAAEMLFSYGFIDPNAASERLVLPVEPLIDDPLGMAKLFSFGKAPTLSIAREHGAIRWESPFVYFACINEEDGLEFRVLQETGGSRELQVFWQEKDVTAKVDAFETHIQNHQLCDVFKLRALTVVIERVESQLDRLGDGVVMEDFLSPSQTLIRGACIETAAELRTRETSLLKKALESLNIERYQLLVSENVVAYLGSTEDTQNDQHSEAATNDGDNMG